MSTETNLIEPRPLNDREAKWIKQILQVNPEWKDADISRTQVVAEGPCDEGISIRLQATEPENPKANSRRESVGELWINTTDKCTINVQFSQFQGQLREMYVLFIYPKHPKRTLPETWTEVSHEATDI